MLVGTHFDRLESTSKLSTVMHCDRNSFVKESHRMTPNHRIMAHRHALVETEATRLDKCQVGHTRLFYLISCLFLMVLCSALG